MKSYHTYIDGLFTAVVLPEDTGKFPTVIMRNPYTDGYAKWEEEKIPPHYANIFSQWIDHGYALVYQHCRGRGKSHGEFVPYIYEREDGLKLQEWIRQQDFYNGELFLKGGSYAATVHFSTAPFAPDVKAACLIVQDTEHYHVCYRNGCLKKGLLGDWYVTNYRAKTLPEKHYDKDASFDMLPLADFSRAVFGEAVESLDDILRSPLPTDPFWSTLAGGADKRGATEKTHCALLLGTGFYDVYAGGMLRMWREMSTETRTHSALVVSPYDHGDGFETETFTYPNGKREEQFGADYEVRWCDAVRGVGEFPAEQGKVSYYSLFENVWKTTDAFKTEKTLALPLVGKTTTYRYDPNNAPSFAGGLSTNFDGTAFQPQQHRQDVVTVYTAPMAEDVILKGKMTLTIPVSSDCEDTCFYARVSLETEKGDLGLRDDITTLVYQLGDYIPNSKVNLRFTFDEHALLVQKGQRLRVDLASADKAHYVRHTNCKGLFSTRTETKIANNTVFIPEAVLTLPIE